MNDEELARARELDALYCRFIDDDREIVVSRMTFGKARLCIGDRGAMGFDDGYCYANPALALAAALVWTGIGDPLDGWHRHLNTGRRRINGDPDQEHVHW
jgi:hypothetical protein